MTRPPRTPPRGPGALPPGSADSGAADRERQPPDRLHSVPLRRPAMRQPAPRHPRLHALPDEPAGLPCGAAALAALTGLPVARCIRVLEEHHGYFPLDSVVIPATLGALSVLGWRHRAVRPDAPAPFGDWSRNAEPGLHLVSLPGHVVAADVRRAPPIPVDDPRLRSLPRRRRAAYNHWLAGNLRATCAPRAYRAHRAALLEALGVDVDDAPPNTVLVVDNGHLCTRTPAPPQASLDPVPVDEWARIEPAPARTDRP